MKRTLFYEDIEHLELVNVEPEVRAIQNEYERLANQERNYYYDHCEVFDKTDEQQGRIAVAEIPLINMGSDAHFDRVLANLSDRGFELKHKQEGVRTEEPHFRLIRTTLKGKEDDIYIGFYLSRGEFVKCERADEMRHENSEDAKKVLFYEDVEEVSVTEAEELQAWYERIADKRTKIEYEESLGFTTHRDILLKYEAWNVKKTMFDNLETELVDKGYEFRHKKEGEQTEQLESSLLKVMQDGRVSYYLFIYLTPLVYDREVNRRFPKKSVNL